MASSARLHRAISIILLAEMIICMCFCLPYFTWLSPVLSSLSSGTGADHNVISAQRLCTHMKMDVLP